MTRRPEPARRPRTPTRITAVLSRSCRVVEVVEFETADPALRGEMTITVTLTEVDGGTEVMAVHDRLPPGLAPAGNAEGWRLSLAKLAALVEADAG